MPSEHKQLGWAELYWKLLVSPAQTALQFSQESRVQNRSWLLVIIYCIVGSLYFVSEAYLLGDMPFYRENIEEDTPFVAIFMVPVMFAFIAASYPFSRWVLGKLVKYDNTKNKVLLSAAIGSSFGVSTIIELILSPIIVLSGYLLAAQTEDAAGFYSEFTNWAIILDALIIFSYYAVILSNLFEFSFSKSFIIAVVHFSIILVLVMTIIFVMGFFWLGALYLLNPQEFADVL